MSAVPVHLVARGFRAIVVRIVQVRMSCVVRGLLTRMHEILWLPIALRDVAGILTAAVIHGLWVRGDEVLWLRVGLGGVPGILTAGISCNLLVRVEEVFGAPVVVEAVLAGVEQGWRDPLDAAVITDVGGPAVIVDQAIVRAAGQGQPGDVGLAAFGEVQFAVMALAAVRWVRAPRLGTAAIAGVQRQALPD